ncbi:MAG: hypothetical protein AMXMBFR57_10200 [Acidimicrobiia bacterium]
MAVSISQVGFCTPDGNVAPNTKNATACSGFTNAAVIAGGVESCVFPPDDPPDDGEVGVPPPPPPQATVETRMDETQKIDALRRRPMRPS